MTAIQIAFALEPTLLAVDRILPSRAPPPEIRSTRKFMQIKVSIRELGMIEPLMVRSVKPRGREFLVLDGHLRLLAAKELGETEVACLVANDDETYTYNNRVNRLATIQEHIMIRRAVERGVPPERLAKVLSVNVAQIVKRLHLLDGLCPEAIALLKEREFSVDLGGIMRKMKPTRQVECAELMLSANNLTLTYASALLAATPTTSLVASKTRRSAVGVTPDQMARMEREMSHLQGEYRLVEHTYGQDVLNLVLAQRYVAKMVSNAKVARFLRARYPDVFEQLSRIAETESLEISTS